MKPLINFYRPFVVFVFLGLFSLSLSAALLDKPVGAILPQPQTGQTPEEVVKIVIDALANNDRPYENAGVETTFNFASPQNRRNTGPFQRFNEMVRSGVYALMLNHSASEFSEVASDNNSALQWVRLTTPDGSAVVFAFRLSLQQEGRYRGMWMTDAVWPIKQ